MTGRAMLVAGHGAAESDEQDVTGRDSRIHVRVADTAQRRYPTSQTHITMHYPDVKVHEGIA